MEEGRGGEGEVGERRRERLILMEGHRKCTVRMNNQRGRKGQRLKVSWLQSCPSVAGRFRLSRVSRQPHLSPGPTGAEGTRLRRSRDKRRKAAGR